MNGLGFIPSLHDLDTVLKILAAVGNSDTAKTVVAEVKSLLGQIHAVQADAGRTLEQARAREAKADDTEKRIARREAEHGRRAKLLEKSFTDLAAQQTEHADAVEAHKNEAHRINSNITVKMAKLDSRETAIKASEDRLKASLERVEKLETDLKQRLEKIRAAAV